MARRRDAQHRRRHRAIVGFRCGNVGMASRVTAGPERSMSRRRGDSKRSEQSPAAQSGERPVMAWMTQCCRNFDVDAGAQQRDPGSRRRRAPDRYVGGRSRSRMGDAALLRVNTE